MEHLAAAAFRELKLAGLEVKYFDHIGIIEIIIWDEKYYIYEFPEIAEYGTSFMDYKCVRAGVWLYDIVLRYGNGKKCVLQSARQTICIRGEMYEHMDYDDNCIGFIDNNLYVEYNDIWIKKEKYAHLVETIERGDISNLDLFTDHTDDILNSEFMPVKPHPVDIKNVGFKIVKFECINKSDINEFVTLDQVTYIIGGVYLENKDNTGRNLFGYVNGDGELFALLYDPQTTETTLASSTQIVKAADSKPYLVNCVDGLYNGYEIKNNISGLRCEYDNDDGYIDYDGNPTDYPTPSIYCYNHIYFAIDADSEEVIELDARKPNGGANTKAAADVADL